MNNRIIFLFLILLCTQLVQAQGDISIRSDNESLVSAFNWAKDKARGFVLTGKEGPIDVYKKDQQSISRKYIPSYWAGYPLRTAFYSRDFCHQAIGAHLLGLKEENFTMMRAFANSANESRKWFPLWALNFDGSPYKLDYRGDDDFVREIPAVFELVEKNFALFQWTGDRRYIDDDVIWNYCSKAVDDFVSLHDTQLKNGVAESTGTGNIFIGTATYNEHRDQILIEAGDGIGSQFKAFESYGQLAKFRGEDKLAKTFQRKSIALKNYFNTDWGIKDNERSLNRGYTPQKEPVDGWGKENSWFLPLKEIIDVKSERLDEYLSFIDDQLSSASGLPENIEAITYVPEIFFKYGQNAMGWKWLKYIISNLDQEHAMSQLTGHNGDYPEVSFVLVQNIVHDMAGFSPGDRPGLFYTCSHLPKDISYIEVDNIPVEDVWVSLKQHGTHESSMCLVKGSNPKIWRASFPGKHKYLWVNGKKKKCKQKTHLNQAISYVDIELIIGKEVMVSTVR